MRASSGKEPRVCCMRITGESVCGSDPGNYICREWVCEIQRETGLSGEVFKEEIWSIITQRHECGSGRQDMKLKLLVFKFHVFVFLSC